MSSTLEAVRTLAPELAVGAEEGERNRAMLPRLVDKLRDAGIFRMMVPKRYGGEALSLAEVTEVIETLGAADGTAAWVALVGVGFNISLCRFPRATVDMIYAAGPDPLIRGAVSPIGRAAVTEGGYRISGCWPFGSGPYKPEWMVVGCVVIENGAPRMGPMGPDVRMALVPGDKVEFLDTWHTVGMRGTDSRDYELKDVFVPEEHAINQFDFSLPNHYGSRLFDLPFYVLTAPTHSAVCLGITRAALEELAELSKTKRSVFTPTQTLAQSPIFQNKLAELFVRYAAIKALSDRQVAELDRVSEAGLPADPLFMSRHASFVGYIHLQAVDIVNEAFTLAGSAPVYSKTPLQRRWRDVRVAAQHLGGSTFQYPVYGGLLAGQPPRTPGH